MGWDRAASVEYAGGVGAGCVVAPGLVLTAYHVVRPVVGLEDAPVVVRVMDGGAEAGRAVAEVIWHRGDAALLACRPQDLGGEFAPVRWGELTCVRPAMPPECSAVGRPLAGVRRVQGSCVGEDRWYRAEHVVTGRINVVDNASRTYSLQVDRQPPQDLEGAASPWQGMSGAGVFCDDLLIGLVTTAPTGWGHGRLDALPVRELLDDRQFCALVQQACGTWPRLEPADLDPLFEGHPQPVAAASYLLSPHSEVVPFVGLATELTRLSDWCTTGPTVSVAVVHGPGGVGKTRLAVELARRVSQRRPEAEHAAGGPAVPWSAGFLQLDPQAPYTMLRHLIRPTLVVVDYAETRRDQVEQLMATLARHRPPGKPVRLLLLARAVPAWWELVRARYAPMAGGPVIAVAPRDVFRQHEVSEVREQAVLAFGQCLAMLRRAGLRDDWDPGEITDLARLPGPPPADDGSGILAVHMDALAGVLAGTSDGLADSLTPAQVLLAHEAKYWDRAFGANGLAHLPQDLREELVAVQRMACAVDRRQAGAAIRTAWDFHHRGFPHPLDGPTGLALQRTLRELYPSMGNGFWGGIGPDALIAHLMAGVEEASEGEFVNWALTSPHLDKDQVRHGLTMIARAAPLRPRLLSGAAHVIASHPSDLMPLAEDITPLLPKDERDAWQDEIASASKVLSDDGT
ncbi:trypsin-like peptidase domain-containing protein [Streptomyces aurantiogriseus]|uniref:Uncharacterized protein n=1 Tax=Streptomyces aurantiogriseus TaxID=66870 RepID=A0A918C778_9ACTN|nr:trypsin-like peptidase domain-containing protein [Streptomyces aurantiogriseus]GGR09248.1 hypothetical protein GCM10010251_26240 [Streptomyces aurantiogriseus]